MASIYELKGEFLTIWNLMDEGAISDEVLAEVFQNTKEELAIKLENYCKFLKNIDSDVAGLDAEIKRLQARKKALQNTKDSAKTAMKNAMEAAGENKMPCGTFKLSISNNPPKLVMDAEDLDKIPAEYWTIPEPIVDSDKIKETLQNGTDEEKAALEGVAHIEIGTHINIR